MEILLAKLNDVAPPPANKVRKYVYCGGVAPTLEVAIMNSMREKLEKNVRTSIIRFPKIAVT